MSKYLDLYQKVGPSQFAELICEQAPYFSTIKPEFVQLDTICTEVILRDRHEVHNHLGTIHAIAICNAAELVAGLHTDISIPAGARWIPREMNVKYLAKAKSDLRIRTTSDNIDFSNPGDIVVPVDCIDEGGENVARCSITMNVKHQ